MSLLSSELSPISSSFVMTPVSKVIMSPYNTKIITTNMYTPINTNVFNTTYEIDTGLNDSYMAQSDMTKYMLYRILDKWLYTDEMCHLLKYLKVSGNKVERITYESEMKSNKICNDSVEHIEKKADYIEEHFLGISEMRKILKRIIDELGYKWYDLPRRELLVVDAVERYLHKKLKEKVGKKN